MQGKTEKEHGTGENEYSRFIIKEGQGTCHALKAIRELPQDKTGRDSIFLPCPPVTRSQEVSNDVMQS
jgi:hypothetical protein